MASDHAMESTTEEESTLQGSSGRLNVILHGLFAFDHQNDEIVAHIPNMGSEHTYKAGTWLAENALAEHSNLKLTGVKTPGDNTNRLNRLLTELWRSGCIASD